MFDRTNLSPTILCEVVVKSPLVSTKETLAHVLPAPMRSFMRETRDVERRLDNLQASVDSLQASIDRLERQLARTQSENARRIDGVSQKLDDYLDPQLYEQALKAWYQTETGRTLDLDNPVTFNEKIQWAKLYDNDPLRTTLSDKLAVRDWVAERIGQEHLIPLLASYDRAQDIDFDKLPNQFVLKANHGSGYNAIVRDKRTTSLSQLRQRAARWLRSNYVYSFGYEFQYQGIERRLLAERYLENLDGDMPDFKFWCFDGHVAYIEYISGRKGSSFNLTFLHPDWTVAPIRRKDHPQHDATIPRPDNLDEMIDLAECLAAGFPHVRVDLYRLDDGTILFGEMTFTTNSGVCVWESQDTDALLGSLYHLPIVR